MIGFDTNILVYATEKPASPKREVALRWVRAAIANGSALMPIQVLAEFYHVGTRKLNIGADAARQIVDDWRDAVTTEAFTIEDLLAAMEIHQRHQLRIWDALIWATCERVGATILATEDLQDGQQLGRVTFLDPFNPANAARLGLA